MFVKKGKLSVDYNDAVKSMCDVVEVDFGEMSIVLVDHFDGAMLGGFYRFGVDLSNDAEVSGMFRSPDYSNPVATWVEPMTDIPTGGANALDVYPVGIEITTTDTAFNPMKVWGGTWTVTPAGAKRVWKRTA